MSEEADTRQEAIRWPVVRILLLMVLMVLGGLYLAGRFVEETERVEAVGECGYCDGDGFYDGEICPRCRNGQP